MQFVYISVIFKYLCAFFQICRLIQVEISFKLKGIALQTIHARELPDCYAFQNTVSENGLWLFHPCTCEECSGWGVGVILTSGLQEKHS